MIEVPVSIGELYDKISILEIKLEKGLEKTKKSFFSRLGKALLGKSKVDDQVLDDLGSFDFF